MNDEQQSGGMASDAMDALQFHLAGRLQGVASSSSSVGMTPGAMSNGSGHHGAHGGPASNAATPVGFDEEMLRRYLASPQNTASPFGTQHTQPFAMDEVVFGDGQSSSSSPEDIIALQQQLGSQQGQPGGANDLQTAIAALGDDARKQLMAILQLAGGKAPAGNGPPSDFAAPKTKRGPSSNTSSLSPRSHRSASKPFVFDSSRPTSPASGVFASSSGQSSSHARKDGGSVSSNNGGLPTFFSNAFSQFSTSPGGGRSTPAPAQSQASRAGQHSQQGQRNVNGQSSSGRTSNGNVSEKPSPALSATTSFSYNRPHRQQTSVGTPVSQIQEGIPFPLPNENSYRSPAIPGTSSSAFFSDNGIGDDNDLLFTPLLSPALTSSTQPGPSVGPLPETFAHLGSHKDLLASGTSSNGSSGTLGTQGLAGSLPQNTGISPMHLFSPLTSPALGPQSDQSRQNILNGLTASAPPSVAGGSGRQRGASKNAPKARPSPIIRPEGHSKAHRRHSPHVSISIPHTNAKSQPQSPAQVYSHQSPAFPPTHSLNMTRMQDTAQAALQDSPSPQQFDLSASAPASAFLQQFQQQAAGSQASGDDRMQNYGTQASSDQGVNTDAGQLSTTEMEQFLSMLGSVYPTISSSINQESAFNVYPAPTGGENTSNMMQIDSQHIGPQPDHNSSNVMLDSEKLVTILAQAAAAQQGHLYAGSAAPLTPASFMNLPQNQYSHLSGLVADQMNLQQHIANFQKQAIGPLPGAQQQANADYMAQAAQGPDTRNDDHQKPEYDERNGQANDKSGTTSANTSPNFGPVTIRERAAASIAEKEAKSAAKNARSKKRTQSNAQQTGAAAAAATASAPQRQKVVTPTFSASTTKKNGKRSVAAALETVHAENAKRSAPASAEQSPNLSPETRKSSHKVAEQRRRDSLKLCFEELRFILPPINPDEDEDFLGGIGKRPGENNVGGQRGRTFTVDPSHPNKGISKVALLRKSNEYVTKLHARLDRRDAAIEMLRQELRTCRAALGQAPAEDEAALDALSGVDFDELEQDDDPVPPTYKTHGLCTPGGPLTIAFKQTEPTIAEEAEPDGNDNEDDDANMEEDDDGDEYKQKKSRRVSSSNGVSTRGNRAAVNTHT